MKKSVNGIMVELNNMQQVLVNKSISIFDENFNTGKTVKGGLISEGTYFYFWSHPILKKMCQITIHNFSTFAFQLWLFNLMWYMD